MIEYLNPLQLYLESMKMVYDNPVYLAFSFRDDYASVAISKDFLHTHEHWRFPRDKTLFDNLVDVIRSVQNDPVEKYHILGIVVGYNNSVEKIHYLMGILYRRGNFNSLTYTCWKDNISSGNSTWDRRPSGSLFWRRITYPEVYSKLPEVFPAKIMLDTFLEYFRSLFMDEFVEMEDGDEEGEDKDLEMEDSRKTVDDQDDQVPEAVTVFSGNYRE